ncbi:hypothetical protein ACEE90_10605 [Corynebacterium phoceense]
MGAEGQRHRPLSGRDLRRAGALSLHALWAQAKLCGESPEKPGIPHNQLTEAELHTRDTKDPDALLQAAWSIEAARVLAWIVGFVDLEPTRLDLADPQELYDVLGFDNDDVPEGEAALVAGDVRGVGAHLLAAAVRRGYAGVVLPGCADPGYGA